MAEQRLKGLVEGILAKNSAAGSVSPEHPLVDVGLTSVDMVNLMLAVEAEFGLTIPPGDITPENFRSIATIGALVARLAGPATPPTPPPRRQLGRAW
jgi:acyl carrier protein